MFLTNLLFCEKHGIVYQATLRYSPQSGIAEIYIYILNFIMLSSSMPPNFCREAWLM